MSMDKVYIKSPDDLPKETGIYLAHHFDVRKLKYITSEILFSTEPHVTWVNWDNQVEWYMMPMARPYQSTITFPACPQDCEIVGVLVPTDEGEIYFKEPLKIRHTGKIEGTLTVKEE